MTSSYSVESITQYDSLYVISAKESSYRGAMAGATRKILRRNPKHDSGTSQHSIPLGYEQMGLNQPEHRFCYLLFIIIKHPRNKIETINKNQMF